MLISLRRDCTRQHYTTLLDTTQAFLLISLRRDCKGELWSSTMHISHDYTVLEVESDTGTGRDDTEVVVSVCL